MPVLPPFSVPPRDTAACQEVGVELGRLAPTITWAPWAGLPSEGSFVWCRPLVQRRKGRGGGGCQPALLVFRDTKGRNGERLEGVFNL